MRVNFHINFKHVLIAGVIILALLLRGIAV